MVERKDLGSWLEGPPRDETYVPGSAFGLPAAGPGSVAGRGRRALSLIIDYALAAVTSYLFFGYSALSIWVLFVSINIVMLTLFGATIGQFVLGLRVLPVRKRWPMIMRALVRTALLMLVVPLLIWTRDRQAGHDFVAGTAVIKAQ
ncbi:RDD family protein [Devriesea agamarum]|uniref:RDD family protein n=1 Tax=Devriesea agamarum TaxID=472569 RepID=UPI00071C2017|nr:RDD family protein [Devriesea agamarum]